MKKDFTPEDELLFLALGGSGEIGMNVNLYGTQGKWVMVDLGLTFADPAYPGVELVLPDLSFIEERRDDDERQRAGGDERGVDAREPLDESLEVRGSHLRVLLVPPGFVPDQVTDREAGSLDAPRFHEVRDAEQ